MVKGWRQAHQSTPKVYTANIVTFVLAMLERL